MPSWYIIATSTLAPLFLTKQILERAVFPQNLGISDKFSELMSQSVHERCGKFAEGHELLISKRKELYVFIVKNESVKKS